MAAVSTERHLKELRKEKGHLDRQMLAKVEAKFQPFSVVLCPCCSTTAHRSLEVSGDPLGHQAFQAGGGSCHGG
ncbi:hypothetical protein HPG69_005126 [Diceros bicornis minor]|uniref:Uncharacterized protein n=1 Tax=Diceros bicornis minor TaxID=77932 RepID=A0A7J7EFT5_DICBM|nr:hypothetical protein HPG69_005126 [Diceros bicornis minor]